MEENRMIVRAMGSHQSSRMISDTWITPKWIIDALGPFDLDPCTPAEMPWMTAINRYTKEDDGLKQQWNGRVWLNPPYSREATKWLMKLADHGNGIALIFARTETSWFFKDVWNRASGLLFLEGRIYFHHHCGEKARANAGAPSVLVAYGKENKKRLRSSGINGKFVDLNRIEDLDDPYAPYPS
jgi:phage N-6-adenine-methyltransferase